LSQHVSRGSLDRCGMEQDRTYRGWAACPDASRTQHRR
jgi:hypothetical protein